MDNFRGKLHTTILCKKCKVASHSFDWFLALSLPIPFVSYPSMCFYYVRHHTRYTNKYEISLKGVNNMSELFNVFHEEVILNYKKGQSPSKLES